MTDDVIQCRLKIHRSGNTYTATGKDEAEAYRNACIMAYHNDDIEVRPLRKYWWQFWLPTEQERHVRTALDAIREAT